TPLLINYISAPHLFSHSFLILIPPPPTSTLFPYTTLFRSLLLPRNNYASLSKHNIKMPLAPFFHKERRFAVERGIKDDRMTNIIDRKSTRLNSSHLGISYAVFCLKKKKKIYKQVKHMR